MRCLAATGLSISLVAALAACGSDAFEVTPIYNHANGRVVVELSRGIEGSERLFVQVRRGKFGVLDCAKLSREIAAVEGASGSRIDGPFVDPSLTKPFYGPEWAQEPTAEMLAALAGGTDSILQQDSANIIVVDLLTGARTRVTTMQAGQYALFPHFRSDGWFYFLVRDSNTDKEYAVASDVALGL